MVYAGMNLLWSIENWMTDLRIDGMKAPLWHIKGITSGTHGAPEKLWLPFHAPKGCQGTDHCMGLQDIVQLRRSPTCTGCSPLIGFVSKAQLILHVLRQFCGQPAQHLGVGAFGYHGYLYIYIDIDIYRYPCLLRYQHIHLLMEHIHLLMEHFHFWIWIDICV